MKRTIVLAGSIALSLMACAVSAQDITIAAGKEDGGYDAAAHQMVERLEQRGMTVDVVNLNGSYEITLALCSGRAQVLAPKCSF
ncbi:hypothetical protein [Cochlodiniinecator piscidefendens]|uniref:hypothetical protein n=1 Tax=Cochlodiniinecator piscidefendens TaxID=2715756 RepID=UPI0014099850|nr:hypothetical protein [Cochlodiniinecator piscidefendens]